MLRLLVSGDANPRPRGFASELCHSTPLGNTTPRSTTLRFAMRGCSIDTGAAATKPPPPVIFLKVAVSHIYTTKSQPSVTFESDSVSHIFNDWRRLSFYNVIMY